LSGFENVPTIASSNVLKYINNLWSTHGGRSWTNSSMWYV